MNLISVEEALAYILKHFYPLEAERVPMLDALDRALAEDVVADINVPPFDNSAMDGYAVRAQDIASASSHQPVTLRVIGDVAAGHTSQRSVERGTAMRIMTGAPLPAGADTVVRFEETSEGVEARGAGKSRETVDILKAIQRGDNVRAAGEDIHAGEIVLPKGTVVRPAETGVLASLGKKEVSVHRRPRVAILATGDELVAIDEPVAPGKIRNSNEYSNAAAVRQAGGIPIRLGIARDNIGDLTAKIRAGLDADADLFLTSAGVSVGDYDMVKDVLNAEGEMHFWQVRMKPGKPLAFGILRGPSTSSGRDVPLLGLPGNPVSAMIAFEVFARPVILTMLGKTRLARPTVRAVLQENVSNTAERRNFIRVVVEKRDGGLTARTTGEQGSGILTSVSRANGLLVIPEDVTQVRKGETVDVQMLDWPEW
ncbi:MAG: molybdopterin molybdotransferase MoeA [Chloroflexota bacterium]|nr:molybdopterin molybdotransferase MoeA [Chloroflexota bacterium]